MNQRRDLFKTNPSIFSNPLSPEEALENVESLLIQPRVRVLSEDDEFLVMYREVTSSFPVRGNLVPDAHLAALLLHRAQIEIVAMNADQAELARAAWRKYGKGNHPAGLNIGDCCAYALAKYSGEPLLFKGDDFNQTDIQAAKTL